MAIGALLTHFLLFPEMYIDAAGNVSEKVIERVLEGADRTTDKVITRVIEYVKSHLWDDLQENPAIAITKWGVLILFGYTLLDAAWKWIRYLLTPPSQQTFPMSFPPMR